MTKNEIIKAIKENNIMAIWQDGQYCPTTGDYRECLFVRIGPVSENNWARFFLCEEDWDWMVPQELLDIAVEDEDESETEG